MAVSAIVGIATGVGAGVAFGFTASVVAAGFALGAGFAAISKALVPKVDLGSQMRGTTVTTRDPAGPRKLIYGKARVGGNVVFISHSGTDNKYLNLAVAFATHEIESYDEIWFNDNKIWTSSGFEDDWGTYVTIDRKLGTASQAASSILTASSPQWTSAHKLSGIAYIAFKMEWNQDKFPQGVPNITAIIRGKKVYDPRTNTTAYSANPALCIRDYLIDKKYGLGESADLIDSASLIAAANICDEQVALSAGGTQDRYQCNGVLDTTNQIKSNIENMLSSMGGNVSYSNGKYFIKASAYYGPEFSFDESSIVSAITIQTKQSRRSLYNGVKGTFVSEEKNYKVMDYPAQLSSNYEIEDGDPIYLDMPLPFVTNNLQAQRLAKVALLKSRQQVVINMTVNLSGLVVKVGDTVNVSNERLGYDNKLFEITDYEMVIDANGDSGVSLTLIETAAAVYDWTTSDEEDFLSGGELDLYDGRTVDNVTNLTKTEIGLKGPDGRILSSVELSWIPPDDAFVDFYKIRYNKTGSTNYFYIETKEPRAFLSGLDISSNYDFRVQVQNLLGVTSSGTTLANESLSGDTTAPGAPTSLVATGGLGEISLSWVPPSDLDYSHVEVYENTTNTLGTATKIAIAPGDSFTRAGLGYNVTRYYWVKAVDYSGNVSSATASVNATTVLVGSDAFTEEVNNLFSEAGAYGIEPVATLPATGDFDGQIKYDTTANKLYRWDASAGVWTDDIFSITEASVDLDSFASGIEPVGIVSSLPNPSGYTGAQVVFNTTDNKLYRYTGTAWTSAVPAADVSGALDADNFPNNLRPVEIVSALPTTGNFEGRQAYLTTDNKLYRYDGTQWTASFSTADLDGTISSVQIANQAVTNAKIAVDAIQGDVIAAGAITATKLPDGVISEIKLANDAVTNAKLANAAVTADIIAANAITDTKILAGAVTTLKLANDAVTNAKIAIDAIQGDVIAAGAITESKILNSAITTAKIANDAITNAKIAVDAIQGDVIAAAAISADKIASNAVTSVKIANDAVTNAKIATNAIQGDVIAANAITTTKISDSAISTAKLAAGAITTAKLAAGAVTADTIAANAITSAKIAAGAVTANEIAANAITSEKIAAGTITAADIAANTITAAQLAAGSVTASEIAANAVTAAKIDANTITAAQIAAGTITATQIATNTITAAQIAAGAIATSELAAGAITTEKLGAGAVTAAKIAADTITAAQIAAGAITAAEIASNAVTAAKILAGSITASKLAIGFGTNNLITNGGAEDGTTDGWGLVEGSAQTFVAQSSTDVYGGDFRFRIAGSASQAYGFKAIPVSPGRKYRYRIAFKASGSASTGLYIRLNYSANYPSGGFVTQALRTGLTDFVSNGPVTTSWQLREYVWTCPANVYWVSPSIYKWTPLTSVELYFDDVEFAEQVNGTLIEDGVITTDKISANAITAAKIAVNSITAAQLAANSVTASEIAANAVTAVKIAADAVTADKIAANAVTAAAIAAGAVTADKIAANSITAGQLAAGSVSTSELAAGAVTAVKIAANSITAGQIAAGAVSTSELAAGAITAEKIATGTITADKIASNSITAGQLAASSVTSSEIASNAITADKINAGTITVDKLFAGVLENNTASISSPTSYSAVGAPHVVESVTLPAPTDTSVGHKVLVIAKVEWFIISGSNWDDDGGDLPEVLFYINKSPSTAGNPIDEWYYTHPFFNDTTANLQWFTTTLVAFDDTAVTSAQPYYLWLKLSSFDLAGGNKITVQNAKFTTIGIR